MSKRTQKFLGLLISVCMLMSFVPTFVFAATAGTTFTAGDFNYKVNTDTSTVTLTSIAAESLSGEVVIPSTVTDGTSNFTVTQLGAAFKGTDNAVAKKTSNMTKLVMADTITTITTTSPFYACRFTEIHLSSNLDTSNHYLDNIFNQCNLLYTVNIPAKITGLYATFKNGNSPTNLIFEGTTQRTFFMDNTTAQAFKGSAAVNIYTPYVADQTKLVNRISGTGGTITPTYYYYDGDYRFSVKADDTAKIDGLLPGKALRETVVIPNTLGGKTVSELYMHSLRNNKVTKNFTMPDTVTTIDSGTFYGWSALENIHLSAALTNGGAANQMSNTFQFCSKLTSVEIPAGITKCYGTFRSSGVKTVTLKTTSEADFYGSSGTAEARAWLDGTTGITIYYPYNGTVPKRTGTSFTATVTKMAAPTVEFTDGDFTYTATEGSSEATLKAIAVEKLVGEVTVPETVTDGTKTYTVTQIGDAFKGQGAKTAEMTSLVLADTITKFTGTATFYACSGLTSIHLPANLTGDGNAAGTGYLTKTFNFCSKLTAVELPAGITKCYGTFVDSGVKTVTITGKSQVDFYAGSTTLDARAWKDGTTGITIYYPFDGTAPTRTSAANSFTATVKVLSHSFTDGNFTYETNADGQTVTLKAIAAEKLAGEVTVPETVTDGTKTYTVTQIGDAFKGQGAKTAEMTSLALADTITKFTGTATFYDCKGLTSIHLPENLTGDGNAAGTGYLTKTFQFCSKLTSVELPTGITKCYGTFTDSGVMTVTITGTSQVDFYAGSTTADARAWKDGTTGLTIYYPLGGTTPTRTSAANSFTATVRVLTPTFTDGDFTYKVNEDGQTVTLTGVATENLSGEVSIPENATYEDKQYIVTMIGYAAFNNQDLITSLTLPDTITTFGDQAFMNMDGLTSFDMPDSVTKLGFGTFYACSNLEEVNLSKNLTGTLQTTFAYCAKLKGVVIPEGVTTLNRTFMYCNIISTVVVPASVATITGDKEDERERLFSIFTGKDEETGEDVITGAPTEPNFVVLGTAGSAIETYMNGKGWNFKVIDTNLPLAAVAPAPHDDGTVTVKAVNFNKEDMAANIKVFCAYYSKADGSLVSVGVADLSDVDALDIEEVTFNMTKGYDAKSVYARSFIWDIDTLSPLSKIAERNESVLAD